jgi:exopolyphosphatase/guanosine-5'-triphosphate,3'-diphosphate pyrophosphatase
MQNQRVAIIDFGTNTCKLLIAELKKTQFEVIYRTQIGVKIGEISLEKGFITEDAQERLHTALLKLQKTWEKYKVNTSQIWGLATSAFRNAKNGLKITEDFEKEFNISIEIIDGDQEAELIYHGIKSALPLKDENVLMMDIGGGSVEFIIANNRRALWKQSFEIGGQRLMDRFMRSDPISDLDIQRLDIYLETQLFMLSEAVFRFAPKSLVGAAGSFETLACITFAGVEGEENLSQFMDENYEMIAKNYEIDRDNFDELFRLVVRQDATNRRMLVGMPDFRADMIVLATCLIKFVVEQYELESIKISSYALKEGYLVRKLEDER